MCKSLFLSWDTCCLFVVIVDDYISFDDGLTILWFYWETVQMESVIDNQKRILILKNIVIKRHTIQILL